MKIENAVPYLGALVTGLDVKRMTDAEWKTLYQTWLDRHVLIVRGQELSKADFLAYSRRFGRLKPHLVKHTRDPENPEITLMGVTSMAKDTKGEKLILDRGQGWHTDSPWDTEICKGTQLYGIEIPSYGGDTLFASMHAAYDALPERLKNRIAPLKVEFRYGGRERKWFDLLDPEDQARPPAVHDMVRVHPETGR
jgi:taurine dioxygenase